MPLYTLKTVRGKSSQKFIGTEVSEIPEGSVVNFLSMDPWQSTPMENRISSALRAAHQIMSVIQPGFDPELILAYAHPVPMSKEHDEGKVRLEFADTYLKPLLKEGKTPRFTSICHSYGGVYFKDIFFYLLDVPRDDGILVINLAVPVGRSSYTFSFTNEVNLIGKRDKEIMDLIKQNRQQPPPNTVMIDTSMPVIINQTRNNQPEEHPHSLHAFAAALTKLPRSLVMLQDAISFKTLTPDFAEKLAKQVATESAALEKTEYMDSAERVTKPKSSGWKVE